MSTNSQYFRQIAILLIFGVASLCVMITEQIKHLNAGPLKNDKTLYLSFDGKELCLMKEETVLQEELSFSTLPTTLKPMFFHKIPINLAEFDLLLTVPGIGPTLAHEILFSLKKNGKFSNAEDLLSVRGIGINKMNHFKNSFSFE